MAKVRVTVRFWITIKVRVTVRDISIKLIPSDIFL